MADDVTRLTDRWGKSRVFWWILLCVTIAVAISMLVLMAVTEGRAGNWFTVAGACFGVATSITMLRALRKSAPGSQVDTDSD